MMCIVRFSNYILGGAFPIKVQSVHVIETRRTYETVFSALHCLDTMISDGAFYNNAIKIPMQLIKQLLGIKESLSSVDPYVLSMVKAYIRRQTQIAINLNGLYAIKSTIKGFVTEGDIECIDSTDNDWNPESLLSSRSNLVSPDLISLFPNATSIIIKAGLFVKDQHKSYPFDMFYFSRAMMTSSNWKSIKIEQCMNGKHNFRKSWIAKLWHLSESQLIHQYKQQQLEISFHSNETSVNGYDNSFGSFKIVRE